MFLTSLAASPNTHPDTLAWLIEHASTLDRLDKAARDLLLALVANPSVALGDLRALVARAPAGDLRHVLAGASRRPSLTGHGIVTLLGQDGEHTAFAEALSTARFLPDGHVVLDHVLTYAMTTTTFRAVLDHPRVTRAQRMRATAALASMRPAGPHRDLMLVQAIALAVGTALPDQRHETDQWVASTVAAASNAQTGSSTPDLRAWVGQALARVPSTPEPGTPAWYAHPSTSTDDVLEYLNPGAAAGGPPSAQAHRSRSSPSSSTSAPPHAHARGK